MYNKRLKITKENYNRLEDCFKWLFAQDDITTLNQLPEMFKLFKEKDYSRTKILFTFYHALTGYAQGNDLEKYWFIRSLMSRDNQDLNDNQLESALNCILPDMLKEYWL